MTADLRDILHTPYELGGRTPGIGLDCLGVVGEIARRRGMAPPDGWPSIRDAWEHDEIEASTGFPPGWVKQDPVVGVEDGDVLLFFEPHAWCSIVDGGMLWSASHEQGSCFCMPLFRLRRKPIEVWRWQP